MDFKLEVVVLPVSDVDRAKNFYEQLGWRLDADFSGDETFRVVQFTPPGSACSIIFGTGVTSATPPGTQSLYLVVTDIVAARDDIAGRGIGISEVFHDAGGVFHHAGTKDRVPGPDPGRGDYASFATFSDPDGNTWFLQEINVRLPGR
jgi:catechol 2,3-dioxygenase-like lactoylglutathione lyase family enzyme